MQQGNPGQDPAPGTSLLQTHVGLMLWRWGKAPWLLLLASLLRDSPCVAPCCATNQGESTMLVPAPLPRSVPATEAAARAMQKCSARDAETQCQGCSDAVPRMQRGSAGVAEMQCRGHSDAVPGMQRRGAGVAEVQSWDAGMQCWGCSDAVSGTQRRSARDAEMQCRLCSPTQPAARPLAGDRAPSAASLSQASARPVPKPASTEPAAVPSQPAAGDQAQARAGSVLPALLTPVPFCLRA